MINEAIIKLAAKEDLSYEMAMGAMDEIMGGKATPVQMSAFLTAMSMKGETIEEITACAAGMRKHCIRLLNDQELLEIVGTGGDRSNSFNISTTARFWCQRRASRWRNTETGRRPANRERRTAWKRWE